MKWPFKRQEIEVPEAVSPSETVTVTLTPIGKQKAERFSLEGPKFDILACLLEEGTMALSEIASKTGMSSNKVKEICKSLAASGYIKSMKVA